MGRFRLLGLAVCSLAVSAAVPAAPAPAGTLAARMPVAPLRAWGGTEIRSLDVFPAPSVGSSHRQVSMRRAATTTSGSGSPGAAPPDELLSDETAFSRWAYVVQVGPIRQQPAIDSPQVARLHWYTEDYFPEVYLLLRTHWDAQGREWVMLRVPMRPNGRTGWVLRQDLGRFHVTHRLVVVDRSRLRMYLLDSGRQIWSAPVAVGKASTPTPAGHFWIRERFKLQDPTSGYWPYAFGTSDYSTLTDWPGGGVVGIHGPYYQPQDIPGRISHGCIRLRTSDDAWLAGHVGLGTPIHVI